MKNKIVKPLPARVTYRRNELPNITGMPMRKIDELFATGELRSIRIGKCRLVRAETLADFLAKRENGRADAA
jgi:hypothetical protein